MYTSIKFSSQITIRKGCFVPKTRGLVHQFKFSSEIPIRRGCLVPKTRGLIHQFSVQLNPNLKIWLLLIVIVLLKIPSSFLIIRFISNNKSVTINNNEFNCMTTTRCLNIFLLVLVLISLMNNLKNNLVAMGV